VGGKPNTKTNMKFLLQATFSSSSPPLVDSIALNGATLCSLGTNGWVQKEVFPLG